MHFIKINQFISTQKDIKLNLIPFLKCNLKIFVSFFFFHKGIVSIVTFLLLSITALFVSDFIYFDFQRGKSFFCFRFCFVSFIFLLLFLVVLLNCYTPSRLSYKRPAQFRGAVSKQWR